MNNKKPYFSGAAFLSVVFALIPFFLSVFLGIYNTPIWCSNDQSCIGVSSYQNLNDQEKTSYKELNNFFQKVTLDTIQIFLKENLLLAFFSIIAFLASISYFAISRLMFEVNEIKEKIDGVKQELNEKTDHINKNFHDKIQQLNSDMSQYASGSHLFENSTIFLAGLHNKDYKHLYFMDDKNTPDLNKMIKSNHHGAIIIKPYTKLSEYINLVESLLMQTKTNIYSMSDLPLINMMFMMNDEVETCVNSHLLNWVKKVNREAEQKSLIVSRLHLLEGNWARDAVEYFSKKNENTASEYISSNDKLKNTFSNLVSNHKISEDVDRIAAALDDGYSNYKQHYVAACCPNISWGLVSAKLDQGNMRIKHKGAFIAGEYIIFDEKIMVKYDQRNELLELIMGRDLITNYLGAFRTKLGNDEIIFRKDNLSKTRRNDYSCIVREMYEIPKPHKNTDKITKRPE